MHLTPFALERYFSAYEFSAPCILCSSDAESWSAQELLDLEPGAEKEFLSHPLGYCESQGNQFLRRQIAQSEGADPEQVLVCNGAEEALFVFMQAALEAGDHLIVHSPCFQPLAQIAQDHGCSVTAWEGNEEEGWRLDLGRLEAAIQKRTRAVAVNFPHNPTGYLMSQGEYLDLIDLLRRRGLILLSDEVYRLTEYDPADRLPPASRLYERAVSMGSVSKAFGLGGLRIGWITTQDHSICRKMLNWKDYTTLSGNRPGQFLAALALRQQAAILKRNLGIVATNLQRWRNFFEDFQEFFRWVEPAAGTIAFPRVLPPADVDGWCRDLVERTGVMLCPGSVYGKPRHFRIGLGRRSMAQAIDRVSDYLSNGCLGRFLTPASGVLALPAPLAGKGAQAQENG